MEVWLGPPPAVMIIPKMINPVIVNTLIDLSNPSQPNTESYLRGDSREPELGFSIYTSTKEIDSDDNKETDGDPNTV
jgi:hypothetical protein